MSPEQVVLFITSRLPGLVPKSSWGETALFYNPGHRLAHGVYLCTLKEHDGPNDCASALHRNGVFRLSVGLAPLTYTRLFGARPRRPAKGAAVATGHNFTAPQVLMPHPIYAWMGWAQILNPTELDMEELLPLLRESHALAQVKFQRATRSRKT
jgi:hypothetical protein